MKKTAYIFFVAAYALVFCSCKKYLDEKSDKSLVIPSTLNDLQGLMDNNYDMNSNTACFGQVSDDDYFLTTDTYNSVTERERQAYTWTLKTYVYPNEWASCYTPVYISNYILEGMQKIAKTPGNETTWNTVNGSAHFFRAYYFLNLLWEYGKAYDEQTSGTDPGIVLRMVSDFNVPSVRSSVKDCYNQVISDLQEANTALPDNPIHPLRPSKAASYGTLARAYLSMRQYDSAFKYADLSLQIKSDLLDYNSPDVNPSADLPFMPYNKEIVFYTTESVFFGSIFSPYSFIDTSLYATYNDNDLRKTVFYFPQNGYQTFKGFYSSNQYLLFSGITTAEMLLTRAECLARMGQVPAAMDDINELLAARWVTGTFTPLSAATQAQALQVVLEERRKELTMRSLRWIDIKRLNKEGANITLTREVGTATFTLAPNDNHYALPLPQDIIDQTGMQQN